MSEEITIESLVKVRETCWWERWITKFVRCGQIPKHVSFIMDGNRRFTREKMIEGRQGYMLGLKQLMEIIIYCDLLKIQEVSVFAFSVENFKRSQEEVNLLMGLFLEFAESLLTNSHFMEKCRFRFYGNIDLLPAKHQELIARIVLTTDKLPPDTPCVNICAPYTARFDIARSVDMLSLACVEGKLDIDDITPEIVEKSMMSYASPPPEILFRTSGEIRFSDYMLWQANHSLLFFVSKLWPELNGLDVVFSILIFQLKSNVRHLLHNFVQWNSPNQAKQKICEKLQCFVKEFDNKVKNQMLDGKSEQKTLPLIENR